MFDEKLKKAEGFILWTSKSHTNNGKDEVVKYD